jgi:geranylgeranyl diphosphate synthase type 3/geranylgeranyl diphosphate synthase type I
MHTREKKLICEAIGIMTKYGAKEYSNALEKKIVTEAWAGIDKKLPPSEAKKRLKDLADFLITRSI